MLFNSFTFLFLFLPVTAIGYFIIARRSHVSAAIWLAAASLVFYGGWSLAYIPLLLGSVVFNYWMGRHIGAATGSARKRWLVSAIVADLLLLGYFKYADFFISGVNLAAGTEFPVLRIVLPIGISFYTFTQIAYLVDTYQGKVREGRFVHYLLFITYFPHLIAGPVLHHAEMMPQFDRPSSYQFSYRNVAVGLSIFAIGLSKKVLIADNLAPHAGFLFDQSDQFSLLLAWGGVFAYSFQLYFDFSGYSDMAIGISLLFGIRLPLNFDSPYKAVNIVDFWRRWHMTLSRFLRDYLYIPLGGNRKGPLRRHINLMLTMVLGGLWHGAGLNFIVWGALHGCYLVLNHGWQALAEKIRFPRASQAWKVASIALTFLAVCVAWVFFRATEFGKAALILQGMAGQHGVSLPASIGLQLGGLKPLLEQAGVGFYLGGGARFLGTWGWVMFAAAIAFLFPNTQQIMRHYESRPMDATHGHLAAWMTWRPTRRWSLCLGALLVGSLLSLSRPTEFLYFQF